MDYKESYIELLETNKRLEKELELIRSKNQEKSEIVRETIFRIFHSANYLMAISKLNDFQDFSLCKLSDGYQQIGYWSVC